MPEERTIVHGMCGRENKIGSWIKYMSSLINCNLSTDEEYSICPTSDTGQNGKSTSSVGLISAV